MKTKRGLQKKRHKQSSFTKKVLKIVKKIPKGSTMSYSSIAQMAGSPGAVRVVGSIMAKNINKNVPCHRVIRSNGSIGSYNGLKGKSKKQLLTDEGYLNE